MDPSSLQRRAAKVVARNIAEEKYNEVDYEFDSDLSNLVYKYFKDLFPTENVIKQFEAKLNITVGDYRTTVVTKSTFEMLKHQKLDRLYIGNLKNWKKEYDDENGCFKIVSFLRNMLNEESTSLLKQLEILYVETFEPNWAISIGQLLSSLEILDLGRIQPDQNDFLNICQSFGKLKVLKMNPAKLQSLNGISKLKHLEVLIVKGLKVVAPENIMELFECKKLKMLDFSRIAQKAEVNIVDMYLKCEKVIEELSFLNCSYTDIDANKLEKLMKTHPNLKRVLVFETALDQTTVPGIELLNTLNFDSFLNIIQHHISIRDPSAMEFMLSVLHLIIDEWAADGIFKVRILRRASDIFCQATNTFLSVDTIIKECIALSKVIMRKDQVKRLTAKDIDDHLKVLIEKIGQHRTINGLSHSKKVWEILNQKHILDLNCLPVRKVCSFALRCITSVKDIAIQAIEYNILEKMMGRLCPEDLEKLYNAKSLIAHMIALIRFAYMQPKPFMTEHRLIIKMALDFIYENTKRNSEEFQNLTTFGMKTMSIFQILMQLCKSQWKGLPEEVRALEIIINFTRLENFEDICGKYLMQYVPDLGNAQSGRQHCFCSIAILSSLICYKLPKKGFYDFWSEFNLRAMTFCSKAQPEQISTNLDIFLTSSILKDTFLNSNLDGRKMWVLLTMKIMLERDGNVKEKLNKSGLIGIVKNYRSKERKVMKMKEDVMRLLG